MDRAERMAKLRMFQIQGRLMDKGEWCFECKGPSVLCKCPSGANATQKTPDAHLGGVRA